MLRTWDEKITCQEREHWYGAVQEYSKPGARYVHIANDSPRLFLNQNDVLSSNVSKITYFRRKICPRGSLMYGCGCGAHASLHETRTVHSTHGTRVQLAPALRHPQTRSQGWLQRAQRLWSVAMLSDARGGASCLLNGDSVHVAGTLETTDAGRLLVYADEARMLDATSFSAS